MANFTPVRPGGVWVFNSILQPDEMEKFDANLLKCANFTDGSTHAPSAFVTVGGSGFQLDGTGHEIAPTGRMTVQAGGEIRLADTASAVTLPQIVVNGSNGTIVLRVNAHTSQLIVNIGASLILSGNMAVGTSSVIAFGAGAIFTGAIECQADLTLTSGANVTLSAASDLTLDAGATLILNGNMSVDGASVIAFGSGATLTVGPVINQAAITNQAQVTHSGTGARTVHRPYATLPDADADVTVEEDSYRVPQIITASRIYTARHTGTIPVAGERIRFHRTGTTHPSALFSAKVAREDSTVLFTFGADREGFCEIEYDGAAWQLVAGASVAVGTSGYYDDVWV